jgi:cGMP-dependent protein kinase
MDGKKDKNESALKPKERKSVEDTIASLRQELQVCYESLKDKNEHLLCLEKDLRDRDVTIKYLKGEYKKLKDSILPTQSKTCQQCFKTVKQDDVKNISNDNHANESHPDTILNKLQKDLKDRESIIKELNRKVVRLSDNLIFVQKESLSKDDTIEEMQHEIDKFRQVIRPFTKQIIEQRKNEDEFFNAISPGVENTRVFSTNETSRLKRTAISAEPLSQISGAQNELIKIPKTST